MKTLTAQACSAPRTAITQEMVNECLPKVGIIVAQMRDRLPAHVDVDELHSLGRLGLAQALQHFDGSKGASLKSYAAIRIRGAILDGLRSIDCLPRQARRLHRQLRATNERLEQELGRPPTEVEFRTRVKRELGVDDKEFNRLQQWTAPVHVSSLSEPNATQTETVGDTITDDNQRPSYEPLERQELMDLIKERINHLPPRERQVLALYYTEGMKLREIAEVLGLSEARVSQIHTAAIGQIRSSLERVHAL